jgi:hypothetical protein
MGQKFGRVTLNSQANDYATSMLGGTQRIADITKGAQITESQVMGMAAEDM